MTTKKQIKLQLLLEGFTHSPETNNNHEYYVIDKYKLINKTKIKRKVWTFTKEMSNTSPALLAEAPTLKKIYKMYAAYID